MAGLAGTQHHSITSIWSVSALIAAAMPGTEQPYSSLTPSDVFFTLPNRKVCSREILSWHAEKVRRCGGTFSEPCQLRTAANQWGCSVSQL